MAGLTVLAGANSSGKSSFMQPFLILKQTLESNIDLGALLLDGANARLADSSDVLSRVEGGASNSFSISVEKGEFVSLMVYKKDAHHGLVPDSITFCNSDLSKKTTISRDMNKAKLSELLGEAKNPFVKTMEENGYKFIWEIRSSRALFSLEHVAIENGFSGLKIGLEPAELIEQFVKSIVHVQGLRGNPERSYRVSSAKDYYPGVFESYVASIIDEWQNSTSKSGLLKQLVVDLIELGLASHIETSRINDTRLAVKVSRCGGAKIGDSVNIADVGFGVAQVLPVLVGLIVANRGKVVYVEQPELHLHPLAQHKMAKIIARAVNRGVRVIIETHSSILIRGIQTLVAKGEILPSQTSLNWFVQDPVSGSSQVVHAQLDEAGAFGDWPANFDEVGLSAEDEYLSAVEGRFSVKV
ncbi:AAA family ATPase [Niveibacterium terrae]|uniref:AAA family ATPase n=1 Tax=Niveibacterium terrae TaxID=3373598 RepID=UPI003A90F6CD